MIKGIRLQKGISLVQWLVFAGILGLVVALSVWAAAVSKAKSRDAVRLSDVKQVQAALELFYNDFNAYPQTAEQGIVLGTPQTRCLDESGFKAECSGKVYINYIPSVPEQADGDCTASNNRYRYYSPEGDAYALTFCLGRAVANLDSGQHQADLNGIR